MGGSMFIVKRLGLAAGIALLGVSLQAATFTIHNDGSNVIEVKPQWNGRCAGYDLLNPGQTKDYNSWTENVTKIKWVEKIPASSISFVGIKDPLILKVYEADSNLGWANVGGHFKIYNGGSYRREFGLIDGINDGNATSVGDI